jgi:oxygen-independent coproporphyrinogen III oxidase
MSAYHLLLKKYDVPVPRYTSYPTVPNWQTEAFYADDWKNGIKESFKESNELKGISLYVHLPFCESLCTYCACNTRITKNHGVEESYIHALLEEWKLYKSIFQHRPIIRELHIGGGTPTFFSPKNLDRLLAGLLSDVSIHPQYEFSLEGHPNNTLLEHLDVLQNHHFKRISFGVQDLSEKVQRAIHRLQPFENVQRVTAQSRDRSFTSVSLDLVYGLPFQTVESIQQTMHQVLSLRPDRLSFYSYAHVPWLKPGQRGYEDADLPGDVRKRALYETGRTLLIQAGYKEIGMDHFALPHDSLYKAMENGRLHRNFMGYTTTQTDMLIGLGASSISETRFGYAQNIKKVEDYESTVLSGQLPILKGHLHQKDDVQRKKIIELISCRGLVPGSLIKSYLDAETTMHIMQMEEEGLVTISAKGLEVTPMGFAFVRNICHVFDHYETQHTIPVFSKAI